MFEGPETRQASEERSLAASVRPRDYQVLVLLDFEAEVSDQDFPPGLIVPARIRVGSGDVHLLELDVGCVLTVGFGLAESVWSRGEFVDDLFELVDESSVASQVLQLFVGDDYAADGFGEVDEETAVSHPIFGDDSGLVLHLFEVDSTVGSEDRQSHDGVAYHTGPVFDEQGVETTHV